MSVNLMSMVKDAVSQQVMGKIGSMIGLDQSKTSSAFETVAGSILGGLIGKSSAPGGMDQIFGAVEQQDTGILDKLGDLLGGGEATDNFQKQGGGVLDMVFGSGNQKAQQAIGSSLGLDTGIVGKLMAMAAPILMGVIGKYVKSKALNAVGLGSLLGEQKQHLGGLLPSSLTSNLGFGNLLSGATDAASNVAGAAAGAASNVAGAASDAASNVAGAASNVASNVGSAASNVAGAATGAAGDAVNTGGGLLKKLIPLAILAAVLFGLWHFVGARLLGGAGDAVNNGVSTVTNGVEGATDGLKGMVGGMKIPGFDMEGLDLSALGEQKEALMGPIGEITEGFGGLATGGEEAANGLAAKIGGFGTALEGMGISDMGETQKGVVGGILGQFTGVIEGMMAKVPGPLQGIVQPAVDKLMETIGGFGL